MIMDKPHTHVHCCAQYYCCVCVPIVMFSGRRRRRPESVRSIAGRRTRVRIPVPYDYFLWNDISLLLLLLLVPYYTERIGKEVFRNKIIINNSPHPTSVSSSREQREHQIFSRCCFALFLYGNRGIAVVAAAVCHHQEDVHTCSSV